MLSVLTTTNKKQPNKNSKENKKTLGSVGHVYLLDIGDGVWVYAYHQTHQNETIKYVQLFVHQLYLNRAVQKFKKNK